MSKKTKTKKQYFATNVEKACAKTTFDSPQAYT